MDVFRVIYEGGIEIFQSNEVILKLLDRNSLRPVLITERSKNGDNHEFLLSLKGELIELEASIFHEFIHSDPRIFQSLLALRYDVGAVIYHCKELVLAYAETCRTHSRIKATPGYPSHEAGSIQFGDQGAPYYEFDALLSAARRAYDKIGHTIWAAFGGAGGGRPDNFAELLKRCKNIPQQFVSSLENSWLNTGSKLKEYRDCTQHFASTDIELCNVRISRLEGAIWRATAPIPDNPEIKSKKKLSYKLGLDALTYSWEVANEVVGLSSDVVSKLPK